MNNQYGYTVTRWFPGVLSVLLLLSAFGCATSGSKVAPGVAYLRMTPEGELFLGEKPVLLETLPKTLKDQGATRTTAVHIEVPDGVSAESLRIITSTLATSGYTRVLFTKPLKKSATVP